MLGNDPLDFILAAIIVGVLAIVWWRLQDVAFMVRRPAKSESTCANDLVSDEHLMALTRQRAPTSRKTRPVATALQHFEGQQRRVTAPTADF
jgi:hypothetical protein